MNQSEEPNDPPINMDQIATTREFMMNEVRARASAGDSICGSLLALESEFADHIFLPNYDSDLSDLDMPGPF